MIASQGLTGAHKVTDKNLARASVGEGSRLWNVIPHTRPLYFSEDRLFCSRYDKICSTSDYGVTFRDEGVLDVKLRYRNLIGLSPLVQRVTRSSVYRMRVLPNGNRVYLFRKGVYTQPAGTEKAFRTFPVERGSRPVSLDVDARGLTVFGEYWDNPGREAIRIFGSRDGGLTWEVVYTFPAGAVRHVHGISYDKWRDRFIICTGDYGDENRLIEATTDFREVRIICQGGQGHRFYYTMVCEDCLVTATDTPLEENQICIIDKRTGTLDRVATIENTCFYICAVNDNIFVSTNAEPSEVNDTGAAHIWRGNLSSRGEWDRCLSLPVDFYDRLTRLPGVPTALFQYPGVFFPEGDNPGNNLVCHCLGLRGYDDAMVCFNLSAGKQ